MFALVHRRRTPWVPHLPLYTEQVVVVGGQRSRTQKLPVLEQHAVSREGNRQHPPQPLQSASPSWLWLGGVWEEPQLLLLGPLPSLRKSQVSRG